MTCVVAWLHKLSKRNNLSEEEFLNMGFAIGQKLQDEVEESLRKNRRAGPAGRGSAQNMGQSKRRNRTNDLPRSNVRCIDPAADEEAERLQKEQSQFSAFIRMQNYFRYGDPIPLTEAILDKSTNRGDHEQLSLDEKLSRADFAL